MPTADERILPRGTAYVSDLGMTGPIDSVIGFAPATVLPRFLTGLPTRFEVGSGPVIFNALHHRHRCRAAGAAVGRGAIQPPAGRVTSLRRNTVDLHCHTQRSDGVLPPLELYAADARLRHAPRGASPTTTRWPAYRELR